MIVKVNQLATPLVRQLIDLAGTSFDRQEVDRFLADAGWVEPMADGIDIGGGHTLWRNDEFGVEVESLWVPFCWVGEDAGLIDSEQWDDDAPEWKNASGDQGGFDTAWEQGCVTVAAELGPPEITVRRTPDDDLRRWNLSAWQVGSVAVIVGQTVDNFMSQGDLELAGIWLFKNAADAGFPASHELNSWLIEGKNDPLLT